LKGVEEENRVLTTWTGTRFNEFKFSLEKLEKHVNEQTDENARFQWECKSTLNFLQDAIEKQDNYIQDAMQKQNEENKRLSTMLEDTNKSILNSLQDAMEKQNNYIQDAMQKQNEENKRVSTLIEEIEEELAQVTQQTSGIERAIEQMIVVEEELQEKQERLSSRSEQITEKMENLTAKEKETQEQMFQVISDISELKFIVTVQEQTKKEYDAEMDEKILEYGRKSIEDNQKLQDSVNVIKQGLDKANEDVESLRCQDDVLKQGLDKANQDVESLRCREDVLKQDLDKAKEDVESLRCREDVLKQDVECLLCQEDDNAQLLHRLENDLTQATDKLRQEVDALKDTELKKDTELEEELLKVEERIFNLSARHADVLQQFDAHRMSVQEQMEELIPMRSSVHEMNALLDTVKTELDTKAGVENVEVLSNQLCKIQRQNKGPTSFTWVLTKEEMESFKHELRSPFFTLRDVDKLQIKLHPRGRVTSLAGFSSIALVRRRQTTNPFETEEEPLNVSFTCGSQTSKSRELDEWDDEFDAAVVENFVQTEELTSEITVTVAYS